MRKHQQVRFRPESAIARGLDISPEKIGAVICRYRSLRDGKHAQNRLDVRFGGRFAWGVREQEFEIVPFSSSHKSLGVGE